MARVRHYEDDGQIYHVTTRTSGKAFHLQADDEKERIAAALAFYRNRGDYRLYGFVVMDNHVHFIIQPAKGRSLGYILQNFKTWTSRTNAAKPAGSALWERRYDDNVIASFAELRGVLDYLHGNPVRAGMVSSPLEYRWSSAHNYEPKGIGVIVVDTDWL